MKRSICLVIAAVMLITFLPVFLNTALGKVYKDKIDDWSITIPKGWKIEKENGKIYLFDKKGSASGTANIIITKDETDNSLDEIVVDLKRGIPKIVSGYQVWKDSPFELSGTRAHLLGGIVPVNEYGKAKNLQLVIKKDNNLYFITATTTEKKWKKYEKCFLNVFKSFKLE